MAATPSQQDLTRKQSTTTSTYQLEKKVIYTRIQNIDSVELVEGRMWWLLTIRIFTSIYIINSPDRILTRKLPIA